MIRVTRNIKLSTIESMIEGWPPRSILLVQSHTGDDQRIVMSLEEVLSLRDALLNAAETLEELSGKER